MSRAYYSARDVVQAAVSQRQNIHAALQEAAALDQSHREAIGNVKRDLDTATKELAETLLPSLEPGPLQRAVALTGYAPLSDVPQRMEADRQSMKQQLATVERDPRFVQRELLRHPRTGTLPRKIHELDELCKPWKSFFATAQHERLERLIESNWGLPEYEGGFWRVSYWKDHSAASDVMKFFPELADFAAFRAQYDQGQTTLHQLGSERQQLVAELEAGERLEAEHARLAEALWTLTPRWLQSSREGLLRHLATTDPKVLEPYLAKEPALRVMVLRASGLGAKLSYLDGLHREKVGKAVVDLKAQDAKMASVQQRYQRKPVNMPAADFEKKFVDRRQKYQKSFDRYRSLSTRVYVFDRWGSAPSYSDYLWWDLMMHGRVDGTFLPEVSGYYHAHPGYVYEAPVHRSRDDDGSVDASDASDVIESDAEAAAAAVSRSGRSGSDDGAGSSTSTTDRS